MLQVESQLECAERERDKAVATAENATAAVDEIRAQALSLANEYGVDKSQLNKEIPMIEEKVGKFHRSLSIDTPCCSWPLLFRRVSRHSRSAT